ncbi:MAG: SRPBCC family protein [Chitinophagaceae bacterium]
MRFIKLFLLSIMVFFIILTCISLLIPSHIRIAKATDINASADKVFSFIKDTTKWSIWHPTYGPANSSASLSNRTTQLKIIKNTDSTFILNFEAGKRTVANSWQVYQFPQNRSLTLQWYMDFKLRWYPWEKFSSLLFKKTYGAMMEQGLENIKKVSEE